MEVRFYSIRDNKAETFSSPFSALNDATAARMFQNEINRGTADNNMYLHPEDFQLFHIFNMDMETGGVMLPQVPKSLVSGLTLKQ